MASTGKRDQSKSPAKSSEADGLGEVLRREESRIRVLLEGWSVVNPGMLSEYSEDEAFAIIRAYYHAHRDSEPIVLQGRSLVAPPKSADADVEDAEARPPDDAEAQSSKSEILLSKIEEGRNKLRAQVDTATEGEKDRPAATLPNTLFVLAVNGTRWRLDTVDVPSRTTARSVPLAEPGRGLKYRGSYLWAFLRDTVHVFDSTSGQILASAKASVVRAVEDDWGRLLAVTSRGSLEVLCLGSAGSIDRQQYQLPDQGRLADVAFDQQKTPCFLMNATGWRSGSGLYRGRDLLHRGKQEYRTLVSAGGDRFYLGHWANGLYVYYIPTGSLQRLTSGTVKQLHCFGKTHVAADVVVRGRDHCLYLVSSSTDSIHTMASGFSGIALRSEPPICLWKKNELFVLDPTAETEPRGVLALDEGSSIAAIETV